MTLTNQRAQRADKIEKTCDLADMVYDDYCMDKDDMVIVVSNSGRNAMSIEMAKLCKAEADMVYDDYCMDKDDMVIVASNSGRNAMSIEMAKLCKAEGLFVVVVMSFAQYKDISARHLSGKNKRLCRCDY